MCSGDHQGIGSAAVSAEFDEIEVTGRILDRHQGQIPIHYEGGENCYKQVGVVVYRGMCIAAWIRSA